MKMFIFSLMWFVSKLVPAVFLFVTVLTMNRETVVLKMPVI